METFKIIQPDNDTNLRYHYLAYHLCALLNENNWEAADNPEYTFILGSSSFHYNNINTYNVIFLSEIKRHYHDISVQNGHYLVIKDINTNIVLPSRSCIRYITYPIPQNENSINGNLHPYDIFVSCRDVTTPDTTIFKLLHPLNSISSGKIIIDSDDQIISHCLNDNICNINVLDLIKNYVASSGLVIGSGVAIVEAIIQNKPFIVVGENGYLGIPDFRIIQRSHENFFSGTIGGNIYDPVPSSLVLDDIQQLLDGKKRIDTHKFAGTLSQTSYQSIFTALREFQFSGEFVFNTDYTIIVRNNEYKLYNRYDRKFIMCISQNAASCISNNLISELDEITFTLMKNNNILIPNF